MGRRSQIPQSRAKSNKAEKYLSCCLKTWLRKWPSQPLFDYAVVVVVAVDAAVVVDAAAVVDAIVLQLLSNFQTKFF